MEDTQVFEEGEMPKTPDQEISDLITLLMDKLTEFGSLDKLDNLKNLSKLEELVALFELKNLEKLSELQQLDKLSSLNELGRLTQLESLQQLEELRALSNLHELGKLKALDNLDDVLTRHQSTLKPLENLGEMERLVELRELGRLSELEKLGELSHLDKLSNLTKIEGSQFAKNLAKLDKLDVLKEGTKSLMIAQATGIFLEAAKFVIVAIVAVFFLTRESTREVMVRALPAVGFGSAAQTSLGLRLLINETTPDQFQQIVEDVKSRIDFEIQAALNPSPTVSIQRRLELVDQVQSYSYQGSGVDLKKEAQAGLRKKLDSLYNDAVARVGYEKNLAHNANKATEEAQFREMKLLLTSKQYPQLLQKVLPQWNKSEGINLAIIVGVVEMKLNDPRTLEDILRTHATGLNVTR